MRYGINFVTLLGLLGCGVVPQGDLNPPRLMETEVSADGQELALSFDEPLFGAESGIDHEPLRPTAVEGTQVKVPLPQGMTPGTGHVWSAEVADERENVTTVGGKFHAPNPNPAGVRLNEVRVAGSGTHTDMVELRVEAGGSLGGWTVEVWTGPEARQRTVLPDRVVTTGSLVVVRYRSPEEPTDTADGALEYWQAESKGLPGTKGLVVLRQKPDGAPTDGLLYSKKPGEAQDLGVAVGWLGPELDPTGCTATRTWCRTDGPPAEWIIVATGGATPGGANRLTPWAGPTSSHVETPKTKG